MDPKEIVAKVESLKNKGDPQKTDDNDDNQFANLLDKLEAIPQEQLDRVDVFNAQKFDDFKEQLDKNEYGFPSPIQGVVFKKKQITLVLAIEGIGKTQVLLALHRYWMAKGFCSAMISPEMVMEEMAARLAGHANAKIGDIYQRAAESPDKMEIKLTEDQNRKLEKAHAKLMCVKNKKADNKLFRIMRADVQELPLYLATILTMEPRPQVVSLDGLLDLSDLDPEKNQERYLAIIQNLEMIHEFAKLTGTHFVVASHLRKDGELRAATEIARKIHVRIELKRVFESKEDNKLKQSLDWFEGAEKKIYLSTPKLRAADDDNYGVEVNMCKKSGKVLRIGGGPWIYKKPEDADEYYVPPDKNRGPILRPLDPPRNKKKRARKKESLERALDKKKD